MRHTAITDILQLGHVSEETAKSIAGHISAHILKTYSHIRMDAKRAALDALVGNSIEQRAKKKPSRKVIPEIAPEPITSSFGIGRYRGGRLVTKKTDRGINEENRIAVAAFNETVGGTRELRRKGQPAESHELPQKGKVNSRAESITTP